MFSNAEIFTISDCVGGLLMYETLTKVCDNIQINSHRPVARNYSSISAQHSNKNSFKNKNVKAKILKNLIFI